MSTPDTDIADAITEAAIAIAHEVTCSPVTPYIGDPYAYRYGAVSGDREILTEHLGRTPTADECAACEAAVPGAIEEALCAMADGVGE